MGISKDLMFAVSDAEEDLEDAEHYGDDARIAAARAALDRAVERQKRWNEHVQRLIDEADAAA